MIPYKPFIDYDKDLEAAILGQCLWHQSGYGIVQPMLSEDCFFHHWHRDIYSAMNRVYAQGYIVDMITVARELCDKGITEVNGQNIYYLLAQLSQNTFGTGPIEQWGMRLAELAARRLAIEVTHGGFPYDDVMEGIASIEQRLKKVTARRAPDDWQSSAQVMAKLTRHMDDIRSKPMPGITTSIPKLDAINGGFRPGNMVVIGARPSVGKSAFMGRIITHAARAGYKVGVMTLEMEDKEVAARMVSAESGIRYHAIDRNTIEEEEQRRQVYSIMQQLAALPIYYSGQTRVNMLDIRAKAEALKRRNCLDMLVIDYLQLVEPDPGKNANREQQVAQLSRGIKLLAMNLQIPIIVLAQLNRMVMERGETQPQLHHLRESGAIEQDADVVMFLHRDYLSGRKVDSYGRSTINQAQLLVRKWRNGAITDIQLTFDPERMKFGV